ncbi:MAG: SHOCT domain-containing protein [Firmicutes bacterium]|nr:SHOCT domain-containing protein [Bacillota bacterium]
MDKIELLKSYKELLDNGVITEEEFETKKKEILEASEGSLTLDSLIQRAKRTADPIKDKTVSLRERVSSDNNTLENEGEEESVDIENQLEKNIINKKGNKQKTKKPLYKKWWVWLIVVVLIVGIFGALGDSDSEELSTDTDTTVEQTQATEATTETVSEFETMDDESIVSLLNSSAEWSGEWKVNDDGFFVYYPEGEMAEAFSTLVTYYITTGEIPDEAREGYDSMVDSLCELSSTIESSAGKPCMLSIVNPSNTDNVLLSFMSGEVAYSAFEE